MGPPWSILSSTTGSTYVMQDCVMGALGKKTVILVTHQVEFLAEVDTILVSS